ncbi:MAG: arginyltransferase [Desulfobacterales bacterium]|nr:arginyltransferase [Desulfobacterales bacterium]
MNTLILQRHINGQCPYLPYKEWITYGFSADLFNENFYEYLISKGFRRSGKHFYINKCPNCDLCLPIRINVEEFTPSQSQKRALKKNQDVTIYRNRIELIEQDYELYYNYQIYKHFNGFIVPDITDYANFLINSPLTGTEMMKYYIGDKLAAISWIDILEESISSVYFAYDMNFNKRSLGVFSILKEIELCKELKKKWLQLGFWVSGSKKMEYKSNYKPYELLISGEWVRFY